MPRQDGSKLSVTQLVAGAAATVTATVAASYFGVGGTLIGAGAVSVLSTVGATIYQHFLDRGKEQIVGRMPARVTAGRGDAEARHDGDGGAGTGSSAGFGGATGGRPWPKWYVPAGAAGAVFLAVMGLVTAFELVTGKPLSNTVQGQAGRGTSVNPVETRVRTPETPASGEATPVTTVTPSAEPTSARTPRTTPTSSTGGTAEPLPGRRSSPAETPTGPAATRSAVPLPDDGRDAPDGDTGAGQTP
jgi:hypothetical protein